MRDQMAKPVALSGNIPRAAFVEGYACTHPLRNLDSCLYNGPEFVRIICHQTDGSYTQQNQYVGNQRVIARINGVPELQVRLYRVHPLILQFVRTEFFEKTDPAAFLMLIEQNAGTFMRDSPQCQVQLIVAIATQRMEDIASRALRMDAHERRITPKSGELTQDQGESSFALFQFPIIRCAVGFKSHQPKMCPACRKADFSDRSGSPSQHDIFPSKEPVYLLIRWSAVVAARVSHVCHHSVIPLMESAQSAKTGQRTSRQRTPNSTRLPRGTAGSGR